MELKVALENIKTIQLGHFPFAEIEVIRQNWEEAEPVLLQYVKDQLEVDWDKLGDDDFVADTREFFAMYLLAEHNCTESFQYLIQYLEFEDEAVVDFLLSDSVTEGFSGLLATIATKDDVARVKKVIENTNLNEYARSCAVTTLSLMYMRGFLTYEEIDSYLFEQLERNEDDEEFLSMLLHDCVEMYLKSCFSKIEPYFKENKVNSEIMNLRGYQREIANNTIESALENLKNSPYHKIVTPEVTDELSHWASFDKPDYRKELNRKIGRNEPCPCGSGVKFKKCCGP